MSFIEFKHIGKKYAGAEHKSVDDFNLNIEEKEFIAFVGPSADFPDYKCNLLS